jgi:hypothetical protein
VDFAGQVLPVPSSYAVDVAVETGCQSCTDANAELAWARALALRERSVIVDESHFRITVRRCASCTQDYLWIFAETVDWIGGDDPQEWLVAPVSADEAQRLTEAGIVDLSIRRHLRRSFGRDDDTPSAQWSSGGINVPPHD